MESPALQDLRARVNAEIQKRADKNPEEIFAILKEVYPRVLVGLLRDVPRKERPRDPVATAIMVRAVEHLGYPLLCYGMKAGHLTFSGLAPRELHGWLVSCASFFDYVANAWPDVCRFSHSEPGTPSRCIVEAGALRDIVAAIEDGDRKEDFAVRPDVFRNPSALLVSISVGWINERGAMAFMDALSAVGEELHSWQCMAVTNIRAKSH